ncbi:MAG TPA: hypothetical protein VFO68_32085 [Actinophytocola sp.]|nr:hypothetical protein [Actinophytocola sp.]
MSFTLDGIEIETIPATMVELACGGHEIIAARVDTGEFVECSDCGPVSDEQATLCQVVGVFRTAIVPTTTV